MRLSIFTAALIAGAPFGSAVAQLTPAHTPPVVVKPTPAPGGPSTPQIITLGVGGNDNCASASTTDAISGNGTYAVNNTAATTGSPIGNCGAMQRDVWFYYTAVATGSVALSTCGQTSADTVIAVWADGSPAGSCPTTQILCLDDFCGLQTQVTFCATAGTRYFLSFGSFSSSAGYNAFFTVVETPSSGGGPCSPQDDGTTENSVGLTAGGALMWMVGFGAGAPSSTISAVETCYGTPLFPGWTPTGPVTIAVYDDPNDDGNPTDGVLVSSTTAVVAPGSIDTDVFQSITLPSAVTINGLFFVTATVNQTSGQFPGPLDQSGGSACGGGGAQPGSWVCGSTTGTLNFNNLAANDVAPLDMDLIGLPGNWLLRVTCGPGGPPGTAYCFGDGTGTACPCSPGAAGNGCPNSVNAAGANLAATGVASVGADTLLLTGSGMGGTSTALYFQGNAQIDVVFGDGKRCVATNVVRLGTKTNAGGTSAYPAPGDLSISVRGGCSAGDVRNYQCWYRNAASFCTAATFNLTNAMNIVWQ